MKNIRKLKFNKKSIAESIKLPFIFIGICLVVIMLCGCLNKTQKQAKEFATPGEATMTIIEHDIPGNEKSNRSNSNENSAGCGNSGKTPESFIENRIENIPYYFIAIYNESNNKAGDEKNIAERFNYLEEMITKADEYNIKITLKFSAQWTAYIEGNPGRLAMLNEWSQSGHQIVKDTGFGFPGFTGFEERLLKTSPEKGINEFILSGTVNGVERKWLTLYWVTNEEFLNQAIKTAEKLDSSVAYGTAFNSIKAQTPFFYAYLDYLHSIDTEGLNSKTIASIIEKKLVPEKVIPEEVLNRQYQ
jgi:hypothetical protein